MTLEFILKNLDRYKALEKFFLKGALQAFGISCLFWAYLIIVFSIMVLLNLSATQLTVSIMVFSFLNLLFSIVYLKVAV